MMTLNTSTSIMNKRSHRSWYLLCYLYSFICMGSSVALTGPTLLEIGRQSHATRQQLPFLYSCRSIGVFTGTFIGGYIVDRYKTYGNSILSIFVLHLSILSAITPLIPSLLVLSIVCFAQGTFIGCIDNVAQILLINVYQSEVGPYMQALHCAFGVGAFLAPIIASPFLDTTGTTADADQSNGQYKYAYYILASSMIPCLILLMTLSVKDEWSMGHNKIQFTPIQHEISTDNDIEMMNVNRTVDVNKYDQSVTDQTDTVQHNESPLVDDAVPPMSSNNDITSFDRWKVVVLVGCFLFLYVGCESGYGNYLTAYTTKQLRMDEHTSSLLTSVFWATFTGGRLLAIVLSIYMSTAIMIGLDLVGCIGSLLVIMVFSHNQHILWICTGIYGLAVASIYPTAINHAEHTVSLSGRHLSILTAFATAGEALIPLLIGESMVHIAPVYMMVIMFTCAALAAILITYVLTIKPQSQHHSNKWQDSIDTSATEMTKLNA